MDNYSVKYKGYTWILALIAASMPISIFSTNFFYFALILYWLSLPDLIGRLKSILTNKSLLLFISSYFILVLGLFYTKDFNYAFHDLKIKLPILILPIVLATGNKLYYKQIRFILYFFIGGVLLASLIAGSVYLGFGSTEVVERNDISVFISHIRFALLVDLALFFSFYFIYKEKNIFIKAPLILIAIWFGIFLFILQALTGIIVLVVVFFILGFKYSFHIKNFMAKIFSVVFFITLFLLMSSYISKSVAKFNYKEKIDLENIDKFTQLGNEYNHNFDNQYTENGHYVWLYYCEKELEEEWNKNSKIDYRGRDKKSQRIKFTLIRYLTSKDLRKDANGVQHLSKQDVVNIENGLTNYIFAKKLSVLPRIYEIVWEVNHYNNGGNPSGHSIAQRLEYLKAAKLITKDHVLFGVGIGDVKTEFANIYKEMGSKLANKWRLRTHNQYMTFVVSSGIIGLILILFFWFAPILMKKKTKDYLFLVFILIALLSMINEDTLETSTGVSFFAFFYALLLFGKLNKEEGFEEIT